MPWFLFVVFLICICCVISCVLVKRETAPVPVPTPAPSKPALSEEELEKKSTAIIEEYLHINDLKVYITTSILYSTRFKQTSYNPTPHPSL